MALNEKAPQELDYWRSVSDQSTPEQWRQGRIDEYVDKTKNFPDFKDSGQGLDLGCGLMSVFDGMKTQVLCVDPLMDEYKKLKSHDCMKQLHVSEIPEGFQADWVACINCIDHMPEPENLVETILSVLKLGGKLFFEVNYDSDLSSCHFVKWNREMVDRIVSSKFKLLYESEVWLDSCKQFWGTYERC